MAIFLIARGNKNIYSHNIKSNQQFSLFFVKYIGNYQKRKGFSRKIEEYCMFFSKLSCYNHKCNHELHEIAPRRRQAAVSPVGTDGKTNY